MACCILMAYIIAYIIGIVTKIKSWFSFGSVLKRKLTVLQTFVWAVLTIGLGFSIFYSYSHRHHLRSELVSIGLIKPLPIKEPMLCKPPQATNNHR